MRILADVHISPRTVEFLRSLGYDTVRVSDALTPEAADEEVVVRPLSFAAYPIRGLSPMVGKRQNS